MSFCVDELQRALAEQSSASAIGPFRLTESAPLCATASVTLLEGRTILIKLTTRGYSVRLLPSSSLQDRTIVGQIIGGDRQPGEGSHPMPAPTGPTFESIEQLLHSVSTMYERRQQEALIAALERVSD